MDVPGSFTFFYLHFNFGLQIGFKTRGLPLVEFIPKQEVVMKLLVSIVCYVYKKK